MGRFDREANIDSCKHVVHIDDEPRIHGMQAVTASIITDIKDFVSGDAIFRRLKEQPPIPSEVPSSLGTLGHIAFQPEMIVGSGENITSA